MYKPTPQEILLESLFVFIYINLHYILLYKPTPQEILLESLFVLICINLHYILFLKRHKNTPGNSSRIIVRVEIRIYIYFLLRAIYKGNERMKYQFKCTVCVALIISHTFVTYLLCNIMLASVLCVVFLCNYFNECKKDVLLVKKTYSRHISFFAI
jgi:hypothetical protein